MDRPTRERLCTLEGHPAMIFGGLAFTADGRRAVSAGGDVVAFTPTNALFLWDVQTCAPLAALENLPFPPWDLALSPDGQTAAYAANDGVHLWNFESGRVEQLLDLGLQNGRSLAFSPDGRYLLVGPGRGSSPTPDYGILLLEIEQAADHPVVQAREVRRFHGHQEAVTDLAFSPDGRYFLSASLDKNVILWEAGSGATLKVLRGLSSAALAVAISPDGNLAAAADQSGVILLWSLPDGEVIRRLDVHTAPVFDLAFDPAGKILYSAADDDTVRAWRVDADLDELLAWEAGNRHVPEITCEQQLQLGLAVACKGE